MRYSEPKVFERTWANGELPAGSKWCVDYRVSGKRVRKYFATEKEANKLRDVLRRQLRREGQNALNCSDATRIAAIEAEKALSKYEGATIAKAVEHYIKFLKASQTSVPINQLVTEFLAAKDQDIHLSDAHKNDLRNRLEKFKERFGATGTRVLTPKEIEEWIWMLPGLSAQSKNNYRGRLFGLFKFAVKRGYVDKNPVAVIEPLKVKGGAKEIFTVDELRAVLDQASPELLPALVLGAFAGVRTAERCRMTWDDVKIERGVLTLPKEKSKTAARRTIKMESCLQAWLVPFIGRSGPIFDGDDNKFCRALNRACKLAGLKKVPNNGLRHSFASYHVAKYGDAERVRGDLGHTTARLLFANYREMVEPEEATRYFNLFPPAPAQNVVAMTA